MWAPRIACEVPAPYRVRGDKHVYRLHSPVMFHSKPNGTLQHGKQLLPARSHDQKWLRSEPLREMKDRSELLCGTYRASTPISAPHIGCSTDCGVAPAARAMHPPLRAAESGRRPRSGRLHGLGLRLLRCVAQGSRLRRGWRRRRVAEA